jgi:hypothetical protein
MTATVTRLPTEAAARKAVPIATGVVDYFPLALVAVAELSKKGNDQHNPGKPLHWDRSKSTDEADALMRHFIDRGTLDVDGVRHSAKVAWRALALLQKELETDRLQPSHLIADWDPLSFVPYERQAGETHQQAADRLLREHQANRNPLDTWRTETREDARRTATEDRRTRELSPSEAMQARAPAESRYGFTVGETVNTRACLVGDQPCTVTGFGELGQVYVSWPSKRTGGRTHGAFRSQDLRHGP